MQRRNENVGLGRPRNLDAANLFDKCCRMPRFECLCWLGFSFEEQSCPECPYVWDQLVLPGVYSCSRTTKRIVMVGVGEKVGGGFGESVGPVLSFSSFSPLHFQIGHACATRYKFIWEDDQIEWRGSLDKPPFWPKYSVYLSLGSNQKLGMIPNDTKAISYCAVSIENCEYERRG